jgi:hypothetical protein
MRRTSSPSSSRASPRPARRGEGVKPGRPGEAAPAYDEALDDLCARAFAGEAGAARLRPLLARYDAAIGVLHPEDPHHELLHALRIDWALVDAEVDGPGDTWAWRVARGRVATVRGQPIDGTIARSICGVFEVWRDREPWLREPTRGLCLPLADRVHLEAPPEGGPAAVWEMRIVVAGGRAFMCRPPLPYPLETVAVLREAAKFRLGGHGERLGHKLRRAWLHTARSTRADAAAIFAATLG